MSLNVINNFRELLLNPGLRQERQELSKGLKYAKVITAGLAAASCFMTIYSICAVSNPIIGTLNIVLWGSSTLVGRDIFFILSNLKKVLDDNNILTNLFNRVRASVDTNQFTQVLLKHTWIAAPIFEDFIEQSLTSAEN